MIKTLMRWTANENGKEKVGASDEDMKVERSRTMISTNVTDATNLAILHVISCALLAIKHASSASDVDIMRHAVRRRGGRQFKAEKNDKPQSIQRTWKWGRILCFHDRK